MIRLPLHPTLVHPHTGEPLQAIGLRRNGTPIWPIMGASEDDPAPPADPPADPPEPAEPPQGEVAAGDGTDWKAMSRKHEGRAREHKAAADKAAADLKAVLDAIATATGQKPAEIDPTKLTAELAKAKDDARTTRVELAVHRTAGHLGVDGEALLDSRAFAKVARTLDPDADDFSKQVEAAIKDATKGGKYKTGTTAATSGGEFTGGTGAAPITEAQLAKMTPAEVAKAYTDGKLKHLM